MAQLGGKNSTTVDGLTEKDRKAIAKALSEADASLTRIAAERDLVKEIVKKIAEDTGLSAKLMKRMIKVHHKASYMSDLQEDKEFENLYDMVVINAKPEPKTV